MLIPSCEKAVLPRQSQREQPPVEVSPDYVDVTVREEMQEGRALLRAERVMGRNETIKVLLYFTRGREPIEFRKVRVCRCVTRMPT
jgi:hypothetical protein